MSPHNIALDSVGGVMGVTTIALMLWVLSQEISLLVKELRRSKR
jgi:hypothetical protein